MTAFANMLMSGGRDSSAPESMAVHQALALVLVLVLAGCAGHGPRPGSGTDGAIRITNPSDFSYLANRSGEYRPHVHDYWGGATELELLRQPFELRLGPRNDCNPSGPLEAFETKNCASLQLPEGLTVFPGTRWVNVTIHWTAGGGASPAVHLGWTAADHRSNGTFGHVADGARLTIPTNESLNDVPHARLTRWAFLLYADGDQGTVSGDARIVIARPPGELPVSPPAPDRWRNATVLTLLDVHGPLFEAFTAGAVLRPGDQPPLFIVPKTPPVVPIETDRLTVRFHYNSTSPEAFQYTPRLGFHGADRYRLEKDDVVPDVARPAQRDGLFEWHLDVVPRQWDSPYANETAWLILVHWDGSSDSNASRSWMDGDYRLDLVAQRARDGSQGSAS